MVYCWDFMEKHICPVCGNDFEKTKNYIKKYCSIKCTRKASKQKCREWVKNNREHIKKYRQTPYAKELEKIRNKKWRDKNKEYIKAKNKEWREKYKKDKPNYEKERYWKRRDSHNLQKKERYKKDKAIILKRSKEWREKNPEILRKYRQKNKKRDKDRQMERYKTDPNFRLRVLLRRRIADCIMRKKMSRIYPSMELLGTDIGTARKHLEKQFKNGMTWENHGNNGWHIDHIIPCSSFDLTDPEQQKKCFHYTNLQPLWWKENISKGGKITI